MNETDNRLPPDAKVEFGGALTGPFDDARTQALLASARAYYHPTRLIRHDAPGEGKYPYPGEPVSGDAWAVAERGPATICSAKA